MRRTWQGRAEISSVMVPPERRKHRTWVAVGPGGDGVARCFVRPLRRPMETVSDYLPIYPAPRGDRVPARKNKRLTSRGHSTDHRFWRAPRSWPLALTRRPGVASKNLSKPLIV